MSQRQPKTDYWQDAPMPREQLVLIPTALEEMIPQDHPVRLVDEILDMMDWTLWESTYHGRLGQPPVHPSIMAKVLLFAMIRRIRSSRSIEYELKHSIDFMWLTSGRNIDYSTICKFRRANAPALKDIFKQMVNLAINLGIAKLSELCIDGTRLLADANKYKTWTASRLAKALEQLDAQIAEALEAFEVNDALDEDLIGEDISDDRLPAGVADLKARREQLAVHAETIKEMDANRQKNGTKGPAQIPKTDPDSRILPNKEGGYAPNYTPMATTETAGGFIVNADVLIGNVEHDQFTTIVDCVAEDFEIEVERVLADSAYTTGKNLNAAEEKQIELVGPLAEPKFKDNPAVREDLTQPVAADQIDQLPINPRTKRFDLSAFIYDGASDCYYCPAGEVLSFRRYEKNGEVDGSPVQRKVYTCTSCEGCPLAAMCFKQAESDTQQAPADTEAATATGDDSSGEQVTSPNNESCSEESPRCHDSSDSDGSPGSRKGKKRGRKAGPARGRERKDDQHEDARRRHRDRMDQEATQEAYSRRQHFGETPFAVIKCHFDFRRFLLRGLDGVQQEWLWGCTTFNLKKLMAYLGAIRAAVSCEALETDS